VKNGIIIVLVMQALPYSMRYLLLAIFIFIVYTVQAQFKCELGISAGYTLPKLTDERSLNSSHSGSSYFGGSVDFLFGAQRLIYPYVGIRGSFFNFNSREEFQKGVLDYDVQFLAVGIAAGGQLRFPLGEHSALRLQAGGGIVNPGASGDARFGGTTAATAMGEAGAGFLWHNATLGIKWLKPFAKFGHVHPFKNNIDFVAGEGYNRYSVSSLAIELKFQPTRTAKMRARMPSRPPRASIDASARTKKKTRMIRPELGVLAGPAFVQIAKQGSRDNDPAGSGGVVMITFDSPTDGNRRMVCFNHGVRLGQDPLGAVFSYVIGPQLNTSPSRNLGFRLSAMVGPMFNDLKPNLNAELTAGVLINKRFAVGIKYMRPVYLVNDIYWRQPEYGSEYRVGYLVGEVKLRFGPRN
jgi:hypothetical protein